VAKHILFVDDNPLLLTGIGRMLRPMHQEWQLAFATGGPAALEALESSRYDVVVADMRMPGVDGGAVLCQAARVQPHAMRIILTGHADNGVSVRAMQMAHQCLDKPCPALTLQEKIGGALTLRDAVRDPSVASALTGLQSLHCRRSAHQLLLEELGASTRSIRRLTTIVASDLGMSLKVLQMANSAFFNHGSHVAATVGQALRSMGYDIVRQLAETPGVFMVAEEAPIAMPGVNEVHDDSGPESSRARNGHEETAQERRQTLGLNVGALALASIVGVPDLTRASPMKAGAYLLALWGIPESAVLADAAEEGLPTWEA
jgi:CheY-like chemotaxis protein